VEVGGRLSEVRGRPLMALGRARALWSGARAARWCRDDETWAAVVSTGRRCAGQRRAARGAARHARGLGGAHGVAAWRVRRGSVRVERVWRAFLGGGERRSVWHSGGTAGGAAACACACARTALSGAGSERRSDERCAARTWERRGARSCARGGAGAAACARAPRRCAAWACVGSGRSASGRPWRGGVAGREGRGRPGREQGARGGAG